MKKWTAIFGLAVFCSSAFAGTPQGARASAACYALMEAAKASGLEPPASKKVIPHR